MQCVSGVGVLCTVIISGAIGFGCWELCTVIISGAIGFGCWGTLYSYYFRCNWFRVLGYSVQLLFQV